MIIQFFDFLYSYNKNKILKPNKIKYNELSQTDVIIIHDYVYQIMKKHKHFKLLIKNNLFNKLCEFHTNSKKLNKLGFILREQDIGVNGNGYEPKINNQKYFEKMIKIKYGKIINKSNKQWEKEGWYKKKDGWQYIDETIIIEDKNDDYLQDPRINKKNAIRIKKLIDIFISESLKISKRTNKVKQLIKSKGTKNSKRTKK